MQYACITYMLCFIAAGTVFCFFASRRFRFSCFFLYKDAICYGHVCTDTWHGWVLQKVDVVCHQARHLIYLCELIENAKKYKCLQTNHNKYVNNILLHIIICVPIFYSQQSIQGRFERRCISSAQDVTGYLVPHLYDATDRDLHLGEPFDPLPL